MDADQDNPWARAWEGPPVVRARDYHRRTGRDALRHAVLSGLAAVGAATGARAALRTPRVQVLLLHHVFEDEMRGFRAILDALARDHELVSYDAAVDAAFAGSADRPAVAFTFDDGLASCAEAGRVLADHGARACFFVCPSIVGEQDAARRRAFCVDRLHHPPTAFLDWDAIEALLELGHAVGSHTTEHRNLGRVSRDEAEDEIAGSKAALDARLGPGVVRHFAWPYGGFANMTPDAAQLVLDAGFASCASAVRGCHGPGPARPRHAGCLRRDNILASWPVGHVLHFLAANARRPAPPEWPSGWKHAPEPRR